MGYLFILFVNPLLQENQINISLEGHHVLNVPPRPVVFLHEGKYGLVMIG